MALRSLSVLHGDWLLEFVPEVNDDESALIEVTKHPMRSSSSVSISSDDSGSVTVSTRLPASVDVSPSPSISSTSTAASPPLSSSSTASALTTAILERRLLTAASLLLKSGDVVLPSLTGTDCFLLLLRRWSEALAASLRLCSSTPFSAIDRNFSRSGIDLSTFRELILADRRSSSPDFMDSTMRGFRRIRILSKCFSSRTRTSVFRVDVVDWMYVVKPSNNSNSPYITETRHV